MSESDTPNRPTIFVAIRPRIDADHEKLQRALSVLVQEDPSIQIRRSIDGQTDLCGMNDLHLELICDRILNEYKILLNVGEPKVIYLETIRKHAEGVGKYIRQTGGRGNYGHVKLRVGPNEPGKGFEFINEIKGGAMPEEYINPIEQGVREALAGGVLAAYEIVDVKVTLFDGSYHEVDSNEMAFKIAGSMAFKDAANKATPVLLEPVMSVEVVVPEEYMGTIIGDLNSAPRPDRRDGASRGIAGDQGSSAPCRNARLWEGNPLKHARTGLLRDAIRQV
jgi:elongation factor G